MLDRWCTTEGMAFACSFLRCLDAVGNRAEVQLAVDVVIRCIGLPKRLRDEQYEAECRRSLTVNDQPNIDTLRRRLTPLIPQILGASSRRFFVPRGKF